MASEDQRYVNYLHMSHTWKRPNGPPRIWRIIEGRRRTASGEILNFCIQEVPEEWLENVLDFVVEQFIAEEPISVSLGVGEDPLAVRELRTLWRECLLQGISTVAFLMNSYTSANPVITGVNVLNIVNRRDNEIMFHFQHSTLKKMARAQFELIQESGIWEKYDEDKHLRNFGIIVHPCFSEQGLGVELFRAHNDIGLAYKIPIGQTISTTPPSQILAVQQGYEIQLEKKYSEFLDDDGKIAFPEITFNAIMIMAKKFY